MKKITINSDIDTLYDAGMITKRCKRVLKRMKKKDAFDIMTSTFKKDMSVSKRVKQELDELVNNLYNM